MRPNLELGDLYTYLTDTKGSFTKYKLKAYRLLQAYNYFHNGYVRRVYYCATSSNRLAILKACVNPSQKTADQNHEAGVVLCKETGCERLLTVGAWLGELLGLEVVCKMLNNNNKPNKLMLHFQVG